MSPALIRRFEGPEGDGWAGVMGLDCCAMPISGHIRAADNYADVRHGWDGRSLEEYVTQRDRAKLHSRGFMQKDFMVPPGAFVIDREQAVFDRAAAICVEVKPLI